MLAPHQWEAVARAELLLARYGGVILADEAGLGKSFVAAELARRAPHRVEAIVPASLVVQWRETFALFDVAALILTHDALASDPFVADVTTPRLLIVDEAHAFRNVRTQRWAALARRSVGAQLVLVTATPFNNSADDLHALVMLIAADDALRDAGVASIERAFAMRDRGQIAAIVRELVIRRSRDVLPDALQFGALERSVIRFDVFPAHGIDELQFPLIGGATPALRRALWRRLESSEAALLESLQRQTRFYERSLDALARGHTLTKRDYLRAFRDEDAEPLQQVLFWDAFVPDAVARIDAAALRDELNRLDEIRAHVRASPCTKRQQLLALLGDEPALVFTSAIATAKDLARAIPKSAALATSKDDPLRAIERFRSGAANVLVATDLASEGLNLQRAGVVVHYDIPWNPMRIEQRNGRAHRIGQMRDAVRAFYFLPAGDTTRVLHIVAAKNRERRRVLMPHESEPPVDPSLPPHLPFDSAPLALLAAMRGRGIRRGVDRIARRHRAGVELLMRELAGEFLDEHRIEELLAVIDCELHRRVP